MYFPEFREAGTPEILCVLAVAGLLLLMVNYILNYLPVSAKKADGGTGNGPLPALSVVICAKNEEERLAAYLPVILRQDYPEFEVVVVNDCSWDNSETVIDELAAKHPNLRKSNIIEDPYYKHGKKFAMLVGIKAARNNHLVFTDADCYPSDERWLRCMATGFTSGKEIVLGYGAYEKGSGFLNKLIRYDTFTIGLLYLSAAIRMKPYMGVGRNLAYTRELFFAQKGFSGHYHIASGDDDLFVNKAANGDNTAVCIGRKAVTYSPARKSLREWRMQKARHLTTAPLYNASSRLRIGFNYFSQYFFYATLFALLFTTNTVILFPIILILKTSGQLLIMNRAANKLNERDLLAGSFLYELLLLIIYPTFHVTKFRNKPKNWNH